MVGKWKLIAGTIPHGSFEDISLAADYYSCRAVIEPQGDTITDLENMALD